MEQKQMKNERVCVTGAGGYIASWLVKKLLSNGYFVHGTVRDPCDEKKNGHLKKLEKAVEKLKLFKADLLDKEALFAAIEGCTGVLHVACPVPDNLQVINPEVEMLGPAVKGTLNVLNACSKAKVKKVVVVSSIAAVVLNPNWPKDETMDERCWSDIEFCKSIPSWYSMAKTAAEKEALSYAKNDGLNVVTICPSIVIGPKLQSAINASASFLLNFMTGESEMDNRIHPLVEVRDVADAILLVYEKPEAEGRYICSSYILSTKDLVEKLQSMFPDYKYPTRFREVVWIHPESMSWKKLENLGWKFRCLEESLMEAVKNLEENGVLVKCCTS